MTDYSVDKFPTVFYASAFASRLNREELAYLGQMMEWSSGMAGDCLWREGDEDNRLGMVVQGSIKFIKETNVPGCSQTIGIYSVGCFLADLAFVQNYPKAMSAYAISDFRIGYLTGVQLAIIMHDHPRLGHIIIDEILFLIDDHLQDLYWILKHGPLG